MFFVAWIVLFISLFLAMKNMLWLILTGLAIVFLYFHNKFYRSTPWRKAYFPMRNAYTSFSAKTAATNPNFASSYSDYSTYLKKFYSTIFPGLSTDEIEVRFHDIEENITNFADAPAITNYVKHLFPSQTEDHAIAKFVSAFRDDVCHPDNALPILRAYTFADIIGRKTDPQNRLEFLVQVITKPKEINF